MNHDMTRGRGWARTGFWVGALSSVAANVAHAFLSPNPSALLILFAVIPPAGLLISIEVIAQVQWRRVWYQALIRWGAVGSVAAIGAVVSYSHARDALLAHGEDRFGASLLPVLVDGLLTVCSVAMLTIGDNIRRAEREAARQPAEQALEALAVATDVMTSPAPKKPSAPAKKVQSAAAKVKAARTKNPAASQEETARHAGVSVRTVARHWQDTAPVNGQDVPHLVVVSAGGEA